ncbi:MAG: hypothetical protein HZC44_06145 [Geobacter sp.]|nr:hypothetical protein [Geobacter sp.]
MNRKGMSPWSPPRYRQCLDREYRSFLVMLHYCDRVELLPMSGRDMVAFPHALFTEQIASWTPEMPYGP